MAVTRKPQLRYREQYVTSGTSEPVTVSGANAGYVISPVRGYMVGTTHLVTTAVTVAVATITPANDTQSLTGSTFDIAVGAAGTGDYDALTDAIAVNEGDVISFTSDGGSTAGAATFTALFVRQA